MENSFDPLIGLFSLVIFFGIFFLLRDFFCWYWKINLISSQLDEQNQLLKKLIDHFEGSREK